jgi:hypothetical protein
VYIQLNKRHYGIHSALKYLELPNVAFEDIYLGEDQINEELLLTNIPDGWLPVPPERILLMVGDSLGSTGQNGLIKFRNWSKYFDSYSLDILKEPLDWWRLNR